MVAKTVSNSYSRCKTASSEFQYRIVSTLVLHFAVVTEIEIHYIKFDVTVTFTLPMRLKRKEKRIVNTQTYSYGEAKRMYEYDCNNMYAAAIRNSTLIHGAQPHKQALAKTWARFDYDHQILKTCVVAFLFRTNLLVVKKLY